MTGGLTPRRVETGAAGVHRIVLPVPFGPGGVSCWLVRDEPLTLVDVGANWGSSLILLDEALASHGTRVEDLERVAITHHHPDHAGALEAVIDRSGAELVADARLQPWLANYNAEVDLDDRYMLDTMKRHGVPELVHQQLRTADRIHRAWGSRADVTHPVEDGDTLDFADRSWSVHARPGHSPVDTLFFDAGRGMAIGGDHLMEAIESVPYITRPFAGSTDELLPRALPDYLASLEQTLAQEIELVLPGHGDAFVDHAAAISSRRDQIERSLHETLAALTRDARTTAYEVALATRRKGILSRTETTLSYVVGYLRILLDAGEVAVEDDGGIVRFRAA